MFKLAVVASMADSGALSAAAQSARESTGTAFEDVLVDMLVASPRETARVVATRDEEWREVRACVRR